MNIDNKIIELESLIEQINDQFEYVAEIYVAHLPTIDNVSELCFTVHTGEAESYEQYIEVSSADKVMVDAEDEEPITVPFKVIATFHGPGHVHGVEGTTLYMADNVIGAESRELDDGIAMLRQKLADICPACGGSTENLRSHYMDSHACQEA